MLKTLTEKEFAVLAQAIIKQDQNDEMIYSILKRLLGPTLRSYCGAGRVLCGLEEDLLHEIYIRVIKKFGTSFWEKKDEYGRVDRSAKHFVGWLRTFARNYLNSTYRDALYLISPVISLEEFELNGARIAEAAEEYSEEKRELLTYAFSIVLDASSDVHIILTWIGLSLMILVNNMDKIHLNQPFIDTCENKTLYEMRDLMFFCAKGIDWLVISDRQKDKIDAALDAVCPDGRRMGQRVYDEFFMTKGAKASISDWYYRMNRKIQKVKENETYNS